MPVLPPRGLRPPDQSAVSLISTSPPTEQDWRKSNEKLYRHELEDGSEVLVKRVTVANRAELLTAFCVQCAKEKDTSQVLCFQRTLAKGEVVGLKNYTNGIHNNGR